MSFRARPPTPRRRRHAWSDVVWHGVAGSAAGVGVIGTYNASTVLGLLAFSAILAAMTAVGLYCVSPGVAPPLSTAVRWCCTTPLTVIVVFGLVHTFHGYGLLVAVGVAASSPSVIQWVSSRSATDTPSPVSRIERHTVDRRFDEMVSRLDDPGDRPR